jgi:hypothetical protein
MPFWGYGLRGVRTGDFMKKPVCQATRDEITTELYGQLRLTGKQRKWFEGARVVPCRVPFITSQFMPGSAGDRADVRPGGARNCAVTGQYRELRRDRVFTVAYSVRSARTAAASLTGQVDSPPPVARNDLDPQTLIRAARVLMRIRPVIRWFFHIRGRPLGKARHMTWTTTPCQMMKWAQSWYGRFEGNVPQSWKGGPRSPRGHLSIWLPRNNDLEGPASQTTKAARTLRLGSRVLFKEAALQHLLASRGRLRASPRQDHRGRKDSVRCRCNIQCPITVKLTFRPQQPNLHRP